MSVGKLSADQLLYGTGTEFDHLQEHIISTREWLQEWLTREQRTEQIAEARLIPAKRAAMAAELDRILIQYMAKESFARGEDRATIMASVINEVLGLGPIEPLWSDPRITEVMVNGPDTIFVEIEGKLVRAPGAKFRDRDHLLEVCQQILMPLNRRVDQKEPLADGRLSDGSRVNIAHFAVAPGGPLLTIRRFPETVWTLKDLIENGSVTPDMAVELAWLVYHKANVVVVGGTGSGKAVSLSTKLPTPTGMTTMGDVQVGDYVLDEQGKPTRVLGKYPQVDPSVFEVEFSDGTVIHADEDHNWYTSTRTSRRSKARGLTRDPLRNVEPRVSLDELYAIKEWANPFAPDALVSFGMYTRAFPEHRTMFSNFLRQHGHAFVEPAKAWLPGDTKSSAVYRAQETMSAWVDHVQQSPKDQRAKRTFEDVHTTREILDSLRTTNGHANHAVRLLSQPVEWPERELKIDPYVFGAWLGDGTSSSGNIAIEESDSEIDVHLSKHVRIKRLHRYSVSVYGIRGHLNHYGVLATKPIGTHGETKHIPDVYLYSSAEQRRALMAGLLDTDGTVNKHKGSVEFANSNLRLIEGFRTVAHSLGYQTTVRSKEPTFKYKGEKRQGKTAYTVEFFANEDMFRLTRKRDLHRAVRNEGGQAGDRSGLRYIVDVRPLAGPAPEMACITVDSPLSLYLCSDAFIPTHNTSLLNALSSCIPRGDRIVTVEDSLELRLHPDAHVAAMEGRPASASGAGEIRIRDLVKNALRMRPDRIVVGEVRDAAALDMLQAMNTGHEGSLTTVHANGADEAVNRLVVLVAQGGEIAEGNVKWLIGDAVDLFVLQRRYEDGTRRVQGIYEVPSMRTSSDGTLTPIPLWEWEQTDTAPDGSFIGDYVKRNEISPELMKARRLHQAKRFTLDDVNRMSELPVEMKKAN